MTIQTNTTDRKALARELAAEIGAEVRYMGVPSCAYQVGEYTVNRDGSISGENFEAIRDFLLRHHFIQEEPAEAQGTDTSAASTEEAARQEEPTMDEQTQNTVEENTLDAPEADSEAEQKPEAESEELPDQGISETSLSLPTSELTPTMLGNLLKLLYAKQDLMNAMTRSNQIHIDGEVMDLLEDKKPETIEQISELIRVETNAGMMQGVHIENGRLTLAFNYDNEQPVNWITYATMMQAIVNRAKQASHINGKRIQPEESEMKYYCHSFLIQLGFRGPAHKTTRQILLGHLSGFAAFKTSMQMEAHKIKFTERRRAARQAALTAQSTNELAETDSRADGEEGKA